MPDLYDELTVALTKDAEKWVSSAAPMRFTRSDLLSAMDSMPSLEEVKIRIKEMALPELSKALIDEVTWSAKARVQKNLLETGTKWVHSFFRTDLIQPAMFDPDGFVIKPAIYDLDRSDELIPLKHLSIREAGRAELAAIKKADADIQLRRTNIIRVNDLIDTGAVRSGTFDEVGATVYQRIMTADQSGSG